LNTFHDGHADVQKFLIFLAQEELNDALTVLTSSNTPQPFYPVSVDRIGLATQEISNAIAAANSVQRQGPLSNAISRVENARDAIGSNITFQLGQGSLMFESQRDRESDSGRRRRRHSPPAHRPRDGGRSVFLPGCSTAGLDLAERGGGAIGTAAMQASGSTAGSAGRWPAPR